MNVGGLGANSYGQYVGGRPTGRSMPDACGLTCIARWGELLRSLRRRPAYRASIPDACGLTCIARWGELLRFGQRFLNALQPLLQS